MQVEQKNRPAEGQAHHEDPSNQEIVPNVYALGDCCASASQPLPALAQVPPHSHLLPIILSSPQGRTALTDPWGLYIYIYCPELPERLPRAALTYCRHSQSICLQPLQLGCIQDVALTTLLAL